ncbi:MAG: hypothetical protein PHU77_00345 [Simplicispira sp.]|nr:hypothetical protein [Simplicispira sp.]
MTKIKHPSKLGAGPVPPTQWELQRAKERITLADHKELPHLNSTMRQPYLARELIYRGSQACS